MLLVAAPARSGGAAAGAAKAWQQIRAANKTSGVFMERERIA